MLKKILIGIVIILGVFAIVVALQPADFRVTRTASMTAPPAAVFAQVNDFHLWNAWSPWAKLDPAAKNSFEGTAAGVGSVFKWSGNKEVGEGIMTIVESRPNELIQINLEFLKPFKATNTAEFTFKPQGDHTVVTWSMYGKNNFISKAVGLFMDCDKMIGGEFEKGLAQMKTLVEKP